MRTPVTVGVVGVGRSGEELVRTLADLPQAQLSWLCDESRRPQLVLSPRYANARVTSDLDDLLDDETLDAVAIATPPPTHYDLISRALAAGKHVFVDGALCDESARADELVRLARRRNLRLMVGHALVFHPAVRKLKELIEFGRLGELYYFSARHHALTVDQAPQSVLWSLGPDQVAVLLHLLDDEPVEALARGDSYREPGVPDAVSCYLRFATGISAHVHLSALDPLKLRRLSAIGSARAAVVDDLEPDRKLAIYETAPTRRPARQRTLDVYSPGIEHVEPLRLACEQFLAGVNSSHELASARQAAAVVRTIEALDASLEQGRPAVAARIRRDTSRVVELPRVVAGTRKGKGAVSRPNRDGPQVTDSTR